MSETASSSAKPTNIQPVVLPPNHAASTPAESYPTTSRGELSWHTLFSQHMTPTNDLCTGIAVCPPRTGHLCQHRHSQAEVYYILDGRGVVTIEGVDHHVEKGSAVFIPGDAEHGIKNEDDTELRWLYVFPTSNFEDVKYRYSHETENAS